MTTGTTLARASPPRPTLRSHTPRNATRVALAPTEPPPRTCCRYKCEGCLRPRRRLPVPHRRVRTMTCPPPRLWGAGPRAPRTSLRPLPPPKGQPWRAWLVRLAHPLRCSRLHSTAPTGRGFTRSGSKRVAPCLGSAMPPHPPCGRLSPSHLTPGLPCCLRGRHRPRPSPRCLSTRNSPSGPPFNIETGSSSRPQHPRATRRRRLPPFYP
mmetsp:Transcript_9833/g.31677  ORF Transcript_9833/g.31677 Transcript_9833/m.31677 type:complete len:210 (-) Transcript_9833:1041-1670(-)